MPKILLAFEFFANQHLSEEQNDMALFASQFPFFTVSDAVNALDPLGGVGASVP